MQNKVIKKLKKEYLYIIFLVVLHSINIGKAYMPYFVPDEIGYWSCAAWLNKINWAPVVSQGGYYGWGYGIFLAPLLKFFNGKFLYYSAICLNILFDILMYFLLISIFKRLKPKSTNDEISICALCVVSYTYVTVYTQLTMTEILLSVLFLLSVRLLYWCLEKPGILSMICMILCLDFMIFVHFRMLVVVIAIVPPLFLIKKYNMKFEKKYLLIAIAVLGIATMGGMILKNALIQEQYISNSTIYNMQNDSIIGRASGLLNIFSLDFWKNFLISIIGKWFYLCVSSMFLVVFGVYYLCKIMFTSKNNSSRWLQGKVVAVYIFSAFILGLLLNAYTMSEPERIDQLYYGRYVENLLLPVLGIGILFSKELFDIKKMLLSMIITLVSSLILYSYSNMHSSRLANALPLQCSGVAGIPVVENDKGTMYSITAVLIIILLAGIMYLILIKVNKKLFVCGVIVIWSLIANIALNRVIYEKDMMKRYSEIYEASMRLSELEISNKEIYYVVMEKEGQAYYDSFFLQFCLKDTTLYITDDLFGKEMDNSVILIINKYLNNILTEQIENSTVIWENNRFYILE